MRNIRLLQISLFVGLIHASSVSAHQSICHGFSSDIEPDMQRQETDFTSENYIRAQNALEKTIPEWMENAFEHNKKLPDTYDKLFQGDIALAHANFSAVVKGYVLKLEYLAAPQKEKESARKNFCKFVMETPYYD